MTQTTKEILFENYIKRCEDVEEKELILDDVLNLDFYENSKHVLSSAKQAKRRNFLSLKSMFSSSIRFSTQLVLLLKNGIFD